MIGVKQNGGGGGSEQNNIDIVKYFSTGTISTSRMVDTIKEILAFMPQIEIDETQSLWFNFLFSDSVTVRYKMIKKGKGTYGVGATPINFLDLHFISSTGTTVADLEENPTTAKYYIEDLGGQTISEFVNAKFLGYEIKDKELGETIFKVGIEPDFVTYWFVGDSGTYGEGLMQSVDSDFELLSEDTENITKVSQLENDSNFIDSVSVQNGNGFEQFTSNELKFEGFSFDPANKKIRADALVPLSAFLDVDNGSDINGVIQNSNRPFKTMAALLDALPSATGETYTIYITGSAVNVTRQVPQRNLSFVSYTGSVLDFTNCTIDGTVRPEEVFHAVNPIENFIWTFQGNNISLVSDYNGVLCFGTGGGNSGAVLKGNIDVLRWRSYHISYLASIGLGGLTDLNVNTLTVNTFDTSKRLFSSYFGQLEKKPIKLTIENLNFEAIVPFATYFNGDFYINNITSANAGNINLQIQSAEIANFTFGKSISINGKLSLSGGINTFNDTEFSNTSNVLFSGTIRGNIISDNYLGEYANGSGTYFDGFKGKLMHLVVYGGSPITFRNCDIQTYDYVVYSEQGAVPIDKIIFLGHNTLTQEITTENLIRDYPYGNTAYSSPTRVTINGTLKTNAKSLGDRIQYLYPTATFKEKLNEIVIRSKKDIVNRPLDPAISYIIDKPIELVAGEFIVPPLGSTILGSSFEVSKITKNVPGEAIIKSENGVSGNIILQSIQLSGTSSAFDIYDTDGTHALEFNDVNFQDLASIGKLKGFRQLTGLTIGLYNVKDGIQFSGTWNGVAIAKLHIRNFGTAGIISTVFKTDADTEFTGRFDANANIDFKEKGELSNFIIENFQSEETYKITGSRITRNGIIDTTQNYTGTITSDSSISDWSDNKGLKNSKIKPYGIKIENLKIFANDADASAGNISIGEVYIETATGYFKTRLI